MKLYAISDNHGKLNFTIPPCNLLIHAGDVCPDFAPGSSWGSSMQEQWLNSKWINWIGEQPSMTYGHIGTYGNHDFVRRDTLRYSFRVDELITIPVKVARDAMQGERDDTNGNMLYDQSDLKIWLSPWSNAFGGWAWMADTDDLGYQYSLIPNGVDIIVSHQPPYGYGDKLDPRYNLNEDNPDGHVGSKELLATIDRVKPKVVVCGHIHSGYGTYSHSRPDGGTTTIYNVALVNEDYQLTNPPTEISL